MSDILELLTHNGKEGTGYFDEVMRSINTHIQAEFEAGRIAPAEYAKVYSEIISTGLQGAISYLTGAPEALERAALVAKQVELADAEIKIKFKELELAEKAIEKADAELELVAEQKLKLIAETANIEQTTLNLTEQGKALVWDTTSAEHRSVALEYRAWAEYATTHDMLPDGTPVKGSIGKDMATKEAQMISFKAKDMFQMVSSMQQSNTAQVTTLGDVTIAPNSTNASTIDSQVAAYYALLGITV